MGGCRFSWFNNQSGDYRIWARLDYSFNNSEWIEVWNFSIYTYLAYGICDHCPMVIKNCVGLGRINRPFHFCNTWCTHSNFSNIVVIDSWNREVEGIMIFRLWNKLKRLRSHLRPFNKKKYSNLGERIKNIKNLLLQVQMDLQSSPFTSSLQNEERSVLKEYTKLCKDEESLMRQKF